MNMVYYGQYALFNQRKYSILLLSCNVFLVQIIQCDSYSLRKLYHHDVEEQIRVKQLDSYCFRVVDEQLRKQWQQRPNNITAPAGETGCIYSIAVKDEALTWLPVDFKLGENSSLLHV